MTIPNSPSNSELAAKLETIEAELKNVQAQRTRLINEIITINETVIESELKAKDEPYGSVNVDMFSITIPKKVVWDQKILAAKADEIKAAGSNVSDYIKVELEVAESKWKAWPEEIRREFMSARTVSKGNPAVKVKKEEK